MPIQLQTLRATPADFVKAFGRQEAIELTSLDDAMATEPDIGKIEFALEDAYLTCMAQDAIACAAGKVLIRLNLRRLMLDIARHQLDALHQRPDVAKSYAEAIAMLKSAISSEVCQQTADEDLLIELGIIEASKPILGTGSRIWTREIFEPFWRPRTTL